jgi:hypothetical protein
MTWEFFSHVFFSIHLIAVYMRKPKHAWCLTVFLFYLSSTVHAQYYRSLNEIFTSSISKCFGFDEGYKPKNTITRYRIVAPSDGNTDDLTQAWFDVSNNNITCSINANGLVEYPSVLGPLKGINKGNSYNSGADYEPGDYITGSQWTFSVSDGRRSANLAEIENPSLDIVDNLFYKWNYKFSDLNIQMLAFAPEKEEYPLLPEPRALIIVLKITNSGQSKTSGKISVPRSIKNADLLDSTIIKAKLYGPAAEPVANSHRGSKSNFHPKYAEVGPTVAGYEAVILLDKDSWSPTWPDLSFSLDPGESSYMKLAFIVGAGCDELIHTRDFVRSRSVLEWANSTLNLHKKATGKLLIPEDPMLAEMFYRYYECGHSCYLLNGNGTLQEPKGGSWSIMSLLNPGYVFGSFYNPEYLSGLIPYLVSNQKSAVSFSLYGSTNPLIMSADYYQRTGDSGYLVKPAYRAWATALINKILSTEYPEATLFPSKNIWDGPSRGDYHTGSQILVWRVLDQFSRIAGKVWHDTLNARLWSEKASACRSAILSKCVIPGPFGLQFAEGTWKDGKIDDASKCHDGEEVAVVQSAFYGIVPQDNALVINHCKASMTAFNWLYNSTLNAMMWQGDSFWNGGYTFPAWLVMIAGAETKNEIISGINLWKSMTDVDGSPWWWPYDVGQKDPSVVNRRRCNYDGGFCDVAKVPYATSVFNTLLINNILGLSGDIPEKKITFRPFSPWNYFEWNGGRIGNAFFDISYSDNGSSITATITNRNKETFSGLIGITVPEGKVLKGKDAAGKRYSRDYIQTEKVLNPGEKTTFKIFYK